MTAREQLAFAAEQFRQADRDVYRMGFARVGSAYRMECYERWIEAVIRFRREA